MTPTQQYISDSKFEITEFFESLFNAQGKLLGVRYHKKIPQGRRCGSAGEQYITIEKTLRLSKYKHGPLFTIKPNTQVRSRIDAVCGRAKVKQTPKPMIHYAKHTQKPNTK